MFDIRVIPDDGDPYEITTKSRDVVRWEALDKRNNLSRLESELRMSDLYGLTYATCLRQKTFGGSLQEFIDTHDLDVLNKPGDDEDEEAAGPTPPLTAPGP